MSEKLKIDDWLDDEQDALTDELSAAFAPRRAEADSFGAAVREQIREAEAGAGATDSESEPSTRSADGLGWAAGLIPPVLLSKGATKATLGAGATLAGKSGPKVAAYALSAVAAMPFFVLVMLGVTLLYAVRGQLRLPRGGQQRTDEREAALAIRAWWRRHLLLKLLAMGALCYLALDSSAVRIADALTLFLLGSTAVAASLVGTLAADGTASRQQVAKLMSSTLMLAFTMVFQLDLFTGFPGNASIASPVERALPYVVTPTLLLAALLCLALGKAAPGKLRRTVLQALGVWGAVVAGLTVLWTVLEEHEVSAQDVDRWVTESRDPQLKDAHRWDDIGACIRLMAASGRPEPPLTAFEQTVHQSLNREGEELPSLYLLPLLRLDRALGTGFAAEEHLPESSRRWLAERRDQVDITSRVVMNPSWPHAISLLGLRDPARFDELVLAGVERMRAELDEFRDDGGRLRGGAALDATLRRISARCGDDSFQRTWRPLVVAPAADPATIRAAGRTEFVRRLMVAVPEPARHEAVHDYVIAAEMLDFLERPDAAGALRARAHRALNDTWTLSGDLWQGAFQSSADAAQRADSPFLKGRLSFVSIDSTAAAVEALARWGVPPPPVDGSRPGIDLLALESYLAATSREWWTRGISSYSALAAGALERLKSLPAYEEQLAARRASRGPLDTLAHARFAIAAVLLAALALIATLRAPASTEA